MFSLDERLYQLNRFLSNIFRLAEVNQTCQSKLVDSLHIKVQSQSNDKSIFYPTPSDSLLSYSTPRLQHMHIHTTNIEEYRTASKFTKILSYFFYNNIQLSFY